MPYTLLLADDSVTIQRVIELTFADEDVTVIAVSDGDQAIERLEASPPDIVLADIGMPGKNGYEVAQYIRQSPRLAHIPVLLLTGAFEPVDQARANEAGCDGVLAKPFEPQLVISRVKDLLARGHHGPDAPGPVASRTIEDADFALPSASDSIWAPPLNDQRRPATPFIDQSHPATAFVDQQIAAPQTGPVPRTELNDYFDRLDAAFSTLSTAPGQNATPGRPAAEPAPRVPFEIDTNIDWFGDKAAGHTGETWDLPAPPPDTAPADLPLAYAPPGPDASGATRYASPPFAPEIEYAGADEDEPVVEDEPLVEVPPAVAPSSGSFTAFLAAPEPETAHADPEPAAEPGAVAAPLAVIAHVAPPVFAMSAAPALELPLPNPPPLPALADAFAALLAAEHADPDASAAAIWPASLPQAGTVTDELIEDVTRRVLERLSDTVIREAVATATSTIAERLVREEIARIKASIT